MFTCVKTKYDKCLKMFSLEAMGHTISHDLSDWTKKYSEYSFDHLESSSHGFRQLATFLSQELVSVVDCIQDGCFVVIDVSM